MHKSSISIRAKRTHFASREIVRRERRAIHKYFAPKARPSDRVSWLRAIAAAIFLALFLQASAQPQARRVVMLKVDGLPYQTVDRFVRERDPQSGKSQLPWIEH